MVPAIAMAAATAKRKNTGTASKAGLTEPMPKRPSSGQEPVAGTKEHGTASEA